MTGALGPRVVLITRETDYEMLLARHATRGQTQFFLRSRRQTVDEVEARHRALQATLAALRAAIPREWRIAQVRRAELDRFLFAPEDVVVAVGQDGLVANVAKYLSGQPVIGVNPEPDRNPGILVPHDVAGAVKLLGPAAAGQVATEDRTMLRAELDSGQALLALNEVFVGHASHQSARYVIAHASREEAQSSSGLIVASGTGATGWALSIGQATGADVALAPTDRAAVFLVREPWPSRATGTTIVAGRLGAEDALRIVSRMNEDGVIFADGMEQDRIPFGWGAALAVRVADQRLRLVPAEGTAKAARTVVVVPPRQQSRPGPSPPPAPAPTHRPAPTAKPAPARPPMPRAARTRLAAGLGWIAFGLLLLLATWSGLHGLTLAVGVATALVRGDAEVFRPDGVDSAVFLGLPLAFVLHLVLRRARGRGLPWWAVVALGLVFAFGVDFGLDRAVRRLAAASSYQACPGRTPAAPPAMYIRDGRCGAFK